MLLLEATRRLNNNEGKPGISEEDIMQHFGITDEDLKEVEDLEIE